MVDTSDSCMRPITLSALEGATSFDMYVEFVRIAAEKGEGSEEWTEFERKAETEPAMKMLWNRYQNDKTGLLSFARACQLFKGIPNDELFVILERVNTFDQRPI